MNTCTHCDGKGTVEVSGHDLPIICPDCNGQGTVRATCISEDEPRRNWCLACASDSPEYCTYQEGS